VLPAASGEADGGEPCERSLEDIERWHIQRVLEAHQGNKSQTAKTLDIDYKTLLTKLKKYGA
jgi:transcriptional regulator with PAS, ATPase and Fis domain